MFYVGVAIGFVIFTAGTILVPDWWKLAWIAGCVAALAVLPSVLASVLDPLNVARIRRYCRRIGVSEVSIEVFPNHYGVHFRKNDQKHYAKCLVKGGQIKWKGVSPEDAA
jgi:hypothetical protein